MIRPPAWLTRAVREAEASPEEFFAQGRPLGAGRRRSAVLLLVAPGDTGAPTTPDRAAAEEPGTDGGASSPHESLESSGEVVVLTERTSALRSHAGQVSFPGGGIDPTDAGPEAAALREAREEVGVDPAGVEVLTTFPSVFVPASDSAVSTVLAWSPTPVDLGIASPAEVARVLRVPLVDLADPAHRFTVTHPVGYTGPGFEVDGAFVWGFTALMLDRLLVLGGLDRPWDAAVTRLLPDRVSGGRPPVVIPPAAPGGGAERPRRADRSLRTSTPSSATTPEEDAR